VVEALSALMDSSRYFPIYPALLLISGGRLTYILLNISAGLGSRVFFRSKALTLRISLSIRNGSCLLTSYFW
jgi:hypothetical protein